MGLGIGFAVLAVLAVLDQSGMSCGEKGSREQEMKGGVQELGIHNT